MASFSRHVSLIKGLGLSRLLRSTVVVVALGAVALVGVRVDVARSPGFRNSSFVHGTLDLTTSPSAAVVGSPSMAPGDVVVSPLVVSNTGTLPLRYQMHSSTVGGQRFAEGLVLEIRAGVKECTDVGYRLSGEGLYRGPLSEGTVGSRESLRMANYRSLDPRSREVLCIRVSLPRSAGDRYQGRSVEASFIFTASSGTQG